jgi:hypothetical protein
MEDEKRCYKCDSRYCGPFCFSDEPGYVYAVGYGYVRFADAAEIEARWEANGIQYGVNHGFRRVEWDRATPAADPHRDGIRAAAMTREAARGNLRLTAGSDS